MAGNLRVEELRGNEAVEIGLLAEGEVVVGREVENDGILIEAAGVSRQHGMFRRYGRLWTYQDLGSTNGSWLNGNKMKAERPIVVRAGDLLQFGETAVRLAPVEPMRGTTGEFESIGAATGPMLLIFARGSFMREVVVPQFGRAVSFGGQRADLPLESDAEELPSLVIEGRGGHVSAYSISRTRPFTINGASIEVNAILRDRDEIAIGYYVILFSDAESAATTRAPDAGAQEEPPPNEATHAPSRTSHWLASASEEAAANSGAAIHGRSASGQFGRQPNSYENDIDETVALEADDMRRQLAGSEMHPSMRYSLNDVEEGGPGWFDEDRILLLLGGFLFLAVIILLILWLLL